MAIGGTASLGHMEYQDLEILRKKNPAWRLLVSHQAAFVIAFLYKEFILSNRRAVAETELIGQLDSFIYFLNQGRKEPLFPRSGRDYLDEWANDDHGWLRKFYPTGQDEPHFDLTSVAQRAIDWIISLGQQQAFIGTESRLITVFNLLHQIVEGAETDPERRIAELERRKAEIEAEINRVKNGQIDVMDETKIKERFWQATKTAREILADFRAVEQNFRDLDRGMRERIATWDRGKGELLETIFQERDGISNSEQGKSFRAFWNFLMSTSYQDDFRDTLDKVLHLKPVQELKIASEIIDINNEWMDAGAYVQETVAALSQQLRRYVDENYLAEERRIIQLVREIENHALEIRNDPPREYFINIDGLKPEFNLPMDRPLFIPHQRPEIKDDSLNIGLGDISAEALFSQIYVDKQKLAEQIQRLLLERDSVSLAQVIAKFPLDLGLAELVTYFVIASESQQSFIEDETEEISWEDETGKVRIARLPRINFVRSLMKI
ncbi:DUF3375 domain-containing protein [Heliophilum fasciatum]|uniref:Uncharacterized protein DUF3375 n=1 Tax=Heliophilum fasciatum TaxID=35700 RepID=A0A4R2S041_9FIRM|nr:DUF3375 domain-containing protein [Heliophilum fasciatum]MCW2276947.1 hypothetical protein [Heliophilum fasciatum]TCP68527.1 uncharacterized protein DUF3375 [Heliophilum fasciatum]